MAALYRAVFAVTRTKRRRFLWCAWWTGEPSAEPFRAPDAWGGGAKTEDQARAEAERAAGVALAAIESRWAGAWVRVRAGRAPFVERVARPVAPAKPMDPYALLGVAPTATMATVRAAFRQRALEHHPDHGGDATAFIAVKRAYDRIVARGARRRAPR